MRILLSTSAISKLIVSILVVVIVLVAAAAGAGYYIATHPATTKPTPTPTPSSTPMSSPTQTPTPTPSNLTTQEIVRDDAMTYIKLNHPETSQFMTSLNWTGGRVTPPDRLGAETYIYLSQGWNVTITYPVIPNPIYTIFADYSAIGTGIPYRVTWQGTWQNNIINETNYVFAQ